MPHHVWTLSVDKNPMKVPTATLNPTEAACAARHSQIGQWYAALEHARYAGRTRAMAVSWRSVSQCRSFLWKPNLSRRKDVMVGPGGLPRRLRRQLGA